MFHTLSARNRQDHFIPGVSVGEIESTFFFIPKASSKKKENFERDLARSQCTVEVSLRMQGLNLQGQGELGEQESRHPVEAKCQELILSSWVFLHLEGQKS